MRPYLFLIPLFPLLGFLFNFTIGVRVLGREGRRPGARRPRPRRRHHGRSPIIGLVAAGSGLPLVPRRGLGGRRGATRRPTTRSSRRSGRGSPAAPPRRRCTARPARRRSPVDWAYLARPALVGDGPRRHLRRLPDPRLLDRVHGARPGLRPVHVVPEPLHVRDAHPRPGRELRRPVRGLGGRRPLLVPAHRLLVPQAERLRRRARRRSSSTASATPASSPGCSWSSSTFGTLDFRVGDGRRPARCRSSAAWGGTLTVDRASACSSAPPARARSSRSTSGCPTRWRARRRSRPSSTRRPW